MRKLAGWMAALLLWAALVPCAAAESKRYETSFLDVFDTFSQVVVYADTQEAAQEILQTVHDELKVYHRLFDIYQAYEGVNNLYTVNQNAGIAPVAVEQPLYDLLTFGKEIYAQTGGKTNIALGSVLSIWHEYRELGLADPEHAAVPSAEELYRAGEHTDIDQMVLDPNASTVYLTDPEMSLDVGAIAKGYAVELTARKMEAQGVDIVDIGGQSTRPGSVRISPEEEWARIENVVKAVAEKTNLAVSIDTFYPEVAEKALKAGAHIINDVTGFAPEMWRAVENPSRR